MRWLLVTAVCGAAGRHRLEPGDGNVLHMAGQSQDEFSGYADYLGPTRRPLGYTSYHSINQLNVSGSGAAYFGEQRAFLDKLGDVEHAVIPHIGLALTPGSTTLRAINAGELDLALDELADGLPALNRPVFLRIGYEFNGHWNGYSPDAYVAAWRRIERRIARNTTTRDRVALVWDLSCDAVKAHGDYTDPTSFFPGEDAVDWWGVNVFNRDPNHLYSSLPNSSCVLGFVERAAKAGFPVLVAESLPRFVAEVTPKNSWSTWFDPFVHKLLLGQPNVKGL